MLYGNTIVDCAGKDSGGNQYVKDFCGQAGVQIKEQEKYPTECKYACDFADNPQDSKDNRVFVFGGEQSDTANQIKYGGDA